jgi:hypothetical protein
LISAGCRNRQRVVVGIEVENDRLARNDSRETSSPESLWRVKVVAGCPPATIRAQPE